jgi:hypothetical protein
LAVLGFELGPTLAREAHLSHAPALKLFLTDINKNMLYGLNMLMCI